LSIVLDFWSESPGLTSSQPSRVSGDLTPCAHALFQQPWWLNALAGESWGAAVVTEDGEIVGRLPFVPKRRFGLTTLGQPPLTPFLGPWIKPSTGKTHSILEREHRILSSLVAALPDHDVFVQSFHHSITNCLQLQWHGFSHSTNYTYIFDDLADQDRIWQGLRETVRGHIRKAERQLVVRAVDDIETFLSLYQMTYGRQGLGMPHSPDLLRRLDAACRARDARRIFLAEGADGVPHAALYLVWDAESAYCLMSGSEPRLRHSGAISLVRWEAIKFAGQVTRRFDFEGSMVQPIERFVRTFGARQAQYPHVMRGSTSMGRLALLSQSLRTTAWRRDGRSQVSDELAKGRTVVQARVVESRRARSEPGAPTNADVIPYAHSLFDQPWWLDAVAPGAWDAATVTNNGEIVGRLPYVRMQRFGFTILRQPLLTQFLGPWIKPGSGKAQTRLEREYEILRGLIAALPKHDVFVQDFHYSINCCLPFYWQGFSQSVRYTYIFDELNDLDKIWTGFRENVRRAIRKAERQVFVRSVEDIEAFATLNRMTYERQGMRMPYSADLVRRLDAACSARGVRRIFLAEGADGTAHAALYLVWDGTTAYYLMGGSDPRFRASGAMSLLMWEAIKFAGQVARRFDFEGSMLQPVERFVRAFGGKQLRFARLMHGGTVKGQLALMAYEWNHARKRQSRGSAIESVSSLPEVYVAGSPRSAPFGSPVIRDFLARSYARAKQARIL
jgi:lipid II:glycine glycyltransferase (peptidoglycan interpeptide bridge formation enzyme)